jgi:hypothetical protein
MVPRQPKYSELFCLLYLLQRGVMGVLTGLTSVLSRCSCRHC